MSTLFWMSKRSRRERWEGGRVGLGINVRMFKDGHYTMEVWGEELGKRLGGWILKVDDADGVKRALEGIKAILDKEPELLDGSMGRYEGE